MKRSATVIGAGLGGLASAALLAARGYEVSVYEKNSTPGGKMQQFESNGYRFDTGPSLLTMPFVLEKIFEKCGVKMNEYLTISKLEPLSRYIYPDGVVFDNYQDRKQSMYEIGKFAPKDVEAYDLFLDHSESLYQKTAQSFLFNPLYGISDFRSLNLKDFISIDAFSTVSKKVEEQFKTIHLKKFFNRFTTYNGSSPYLAPATLNVIPHVELNLGGYYVNGGIYNIARALHKLASNLGATFYFNCPVHKIEVTKKRVTTIHLENEDTINSDLCVANSDAADTLLNLLPQKAVSKRKRAKQESLEPSCSGFVLMLGCNRQWDLLKHHTIFFSKDYKQEFIDIFENKQLPDDPTIYVANTSYSDSDHAPEGSSNLFVLINAPYVDEKHHWHEMAKTYRQFIIEELEKRGLDGLSGSIEVSETITPSDFLKKYRSNKGSIYGTSSNSKTAAFSRPRNKFRGIKNLYLVGGSTHPGGGIPLVLQSAFNALELIERYET